MIRKIVEHVGRALKGELDIPEEQLKSLNSVCRVDINPSKEITEIINRFSYVNENTRPANPDTKLPQKKRLKRFVKSILKFKPDFKQLTYSFYDQWHGSYKSFYEKDVYEILEKYRDTNVVVKPCEGYKLQVKKKEIASLQVSAQI